MIMASVICMLLSPLKASYKVSTKWRVVGRVRVMIIFVAA
jgi:hypothetical protein